MRYDIHHYTNCFHSNNPDQPVHLHKHHPIASGQHQGRIKEGEEGMKTAEEWVEQFKIDGDGEFTHSEEIAYMTQFIRDVQHDVMDDMDHYLQFVYDIARSNYKMSHGNAGRFKFITDKNSDLRS